MSAPDLAAAIKSVRYSLSQQLNVDNDPRDLTLVCDAAERALQAPEPRSEQPDLRERASSLYAFIVHNYLADRPASTAIDKVLAFASQCVEAERENALHAIGEHAKIANDALKERDAEREKNRRLVEALDNYRSGLAAGFGLACADGAAHESIVGKALGLEKHHCEHHERERRLVEAGNALDDSLCEHFGCCGELAESSDDAVLDAWRALVDEVKP